MLIKPTLKAYLVAHSQNGNWTGATLDGKPVIETHNGVEMAEPYLNHLGIQINKSNKYVGIKNEDMERSQSTGHIAVAGDGDGQSTE